MDSYGDRSACALHYRFAVVSAVGPCGKAFSNYSKVKIYIRKDWTDMNGISYSLPLRMLFKRYFCAKCGAKLKRERTHRVVKKEDKDYFRYHSRGSFPRRNYDVYDYRFRCPSCEARIAYDEQRIIGRIQKHLGHPILSASEIKEHYEQHKKVTHKAVLLQHILLPVVFSAIAVILKCIPGSDGNTGNYTAPAIFFAVVAAVFAVRAILRYKGADQMLSGDSYSYEKEAQLKKLHAYSSHNKDLVTASGKCYCFYCKAVVSSYLVKDFADHGQTAICPRCGIDSMIPDSVDEVLNENIISEMNEYWF